MSTDKAAFESWRKTQAWATVTDQSAEDPADDGSFKRLMDMAGWTAYQAGLKAGREQGLADAAEKCDEMVLYTGYDCAAAIRNLREG